ncbi:MAG: glucokinase [Acidobacteria bacterium RIFCSPLOWO2_02_FULL_68_18]|nr:MAG: glucokinase [Acidobacteria bacterium RIFCSPLOWO2_02_FULL_68_18]OFW51041.1 MAG: glucokinase [Acidobacteria bacterium RIFCSPLOWO2_12_FULL_68_19]
MLLAGDVGGTKTLLGLFERADRRPRRIHAFSYPTTAFDSFGAMLDAFAREAGRPLRIDAAAVGVAGPVLAGHARLTNIVWDIGDDEIAARLGTSRVRLVNDLEALANSADVLADEEVAVLQQGVLREDGHAVVIAAGTGLGQAHLLRVGRRLRPVPSEGGHADFAPRTDREIELLRMLRAEYGRAEVEHVLSGPGLLNLHRFTHGGRPCGEVGALTSATSPAAVSQAAMSARCQACVESLAIFVSAYGAEAGNLALRGMATSGVWVGGGIAPKILPLLQDGRFIEAFCAKGVMAPLVAQIPVKVIVNPEAGLLGAAVFAQELVDA